MKYRKIIITALLVFVFAGMTAITVAAQPDKRAANIKSRGVFDYQHGTALMDASDLTYLANEIDLLEDTYKKETVDALNQVGTYFKSDGTTTIDPAEGTLQAEDANVLEYRTIKEALINSQAIPALPFSGKRPGETDPVSGTITGATAENISLGAAAWVDGKLIIGNGGDNISYYNQGYVAGKAETMDGVDISYTYHAHTGSPSEGGGCYTKTVYKNEKKTITEACPGYYHYIATEVNGDLIFSCDKCGMDQALSAEYGTGYISKCPNTSWTHTVTVQVFDHYDPGCGKTTSTIEAATIIFK